MTLYEFNGLTLEEKYLTVIDRGTFLDNYVSELERCNLYAIDKFFVELVYNSERNKVSTIRSFVTGHLMDKYSNLK